jgi:REP element-mobilizing transposase RayT
MPWGLKRYQEARCLHFVTFSCYARAPRLASPHARDLFQKTFEDTRQWYGFYIAGYVVMPEHVHLLITEPEVGTPSTVLQVLKQRTAHALLPRRKRRNPRQRSSFGNEAQRRAFNVLDSHEARGKAEVHASQPGKARAGKIAGAMALEQLPFLSSG